jgi:hypothetical protein
MQPLVWQNGAGVLIGGPDCHFHYCTSDVGGRNRNVWTVAAGAFALDACSAMRSLINGDAGGDIP